MCLRREVLVIPVACDFFLVLFSVCLENHSGGCASQLKPHIHLSGIHCFLSSEKLLCSFIKMREVTVIKGVFFLEVAASNRRSNYRCFFKV